MATNPIPLNPMKASQAEILALLDSAEMDIASDVKGIWGVWDATPDGRWFVKADEESENRLGVTIRSNREAREKLSEAKDLFDDAEADDQEEYDLVTLLYEVNLL